MLCLDQPQRQIICAIFLLNSSYRRKTNGEHFHVQMACGYISVWLAILGRLTALSYGAEPFDDSVTTTNDQLSPYGDIGYPAWLTRQTESSLAIRVGCSLVRIPSENLKEV